MVADCNSGQILEFIIEKEQMREIKIVYEQRGSQIFKICQVYNPNHECLAIIFFEKNSRKFGVTKSRAKIKLIKRSNSEGKFSEIKGSTLALPESSQYRRYSLFQLRSGKLICTACGFKNLYAITIKEHGDTYKLSLRVLKISFKDEAERVQYKRKEIEISCCELSHHSQDGDLIYLAYKFNNKFNNKIVSISQIDHQYSPGGKIILTEQNFKEVKYNIREIFYCPSYNCILLRDE